MEQTISLGGYNVLTNVGAAYDAIAPSRGLGVALVDFTNVDNVDFVLGVNKVGTGTQSWQLWNETDGSEIGVIDDAGAAGNKTLSGTIPKNALPNGVKTVRVRCKSTVAADDPVYYGSSLKLNRTARSVERCGLFEQLIRNSYGLVRDMRDNANGYKAQVIAGRTAEQIAPVMVADADRYLARVQWITDAVTRNQALVSDALGDLGLTLSQANTLKQTLTDAANHTKLATLTTTQQINTEADWILANVPNYERLW